MLDGILIVRKVMASRHVMIKLLLCISESMLNKILIKYKELCNYQ